MKEGLLVHKHLIVRAEAIRPPMDEAYLTEWLNDFITSINMKVLMGPYVIYHNVPGNRGITGAAIIETSHIVMHVWDEPSPALMQFDVYSCGEFDPEEVDINANGAGYTIKAGSNKGKTLGHIQAPTKKI